MAMEEVRKKIILVGDNAVGKTSLIRRFVTNSFDDKYISTIGTKVSKKAMNVSASNKPLSLHLMIWDMIGQRNYKMILSSALRGTHGVMLVCDLTRRSTLESLESYWIPEIKRTSGLVPMVFLANKSDIKGRAEFGIEKMLELSDKYRASSYLTSAKTGEGVEGAFQELGRKTLLEERVERRPSEDNAPLSENEERPRELSVVLDELIHEFCSYWKTEEAGMAIVRQQAKNADLDINRPTQEQTKRFIELLRDVESGYLEAGKAENNFRRRKRRLDEVVNG